MSITAVAEADVSDATDGGGAAEADVGRAAVAAVIGRGAALGAAIAAAVGCVAGPAAASNAVGGWDGSAINAPAGADAIVVDGG